MISGVGSFDVSTNRLIGIAAGRSSRSGLRTGAIRPAADVEAGRRTNTQSKSELTDEERALIAKLGQSKGQTVGPASTAGASATPNPRPNATAPSPKNLENNDKRGGVKSEAELTDEQQAEVADLKKRDAEVRRHEQAHKGAAGAHAKGGPKFDFETGPDGKQYAVGGQVDVDVSPVEGDPRATIAKMQQIRSAALAPSQPSSKDRQVAAAAAQQEREARAEQSKESGESQASPGSEGSVDGPALANPNAKQDQSERIRAAFAKNAPSKAGQFIDVAA